MVYTNTQRILIEAKTRTKEAVFYRFFCIGKVRDFFKERRCYTFIEKSDAQ